MNYIISFVIGGLICAVTQIFIDKTKLMPGRIMVGLVVIGAFFSLIGLYEPFVDFAGSGASVPLLGFGHTIMQGVIDGINSDGILGIFKNSLAACSVGISFALILGYISSLIFNPKTH